MQIKLNWHEAIELGSSNQVRQTLQNLDFNEIPNIAGIYIFYRQKRNGEQEALYIGQSLDICKRLKQHSNNLELVEYLENSSQGTKYFIFAEVNIKNRTDENLRYALNQAERGYIQYLLDNNHPLLNKKIYEDKFDQLIPRGENLIELISDEIEVYQK